MTGLVVVFCLLAMPTIGQSLDVRGALSSNDVVAVLNLAETQCRSQQVWLIQERISDHRPSAHPSAWVCYQPESTNASVAIGNCFVCRTFQSSNEQARIQAQYDRKGPSSGYVVSDRWYILTGRDSGRYGRVIETQETGKFSERLFAVSGEFTPDEIAEIVMAMEGLVAESTEMRAILSSPLNIQQIERLSNDTVKTKVGLGRGYDITIHRLKAKWVLMTATGWVS